MRVFVFGAGASKAANESCPLVNDLFLPPYRDNYFADTGLTRERLTAWHQEVLAHEGDLEAWLTEKWERIASLRHSQAARYAEFGQLTFYLWNTFSTLSAPRPESAYARLLDYLIDADAECGFVSFNYDTLFDQELARRGHPLLDFDDYARARYFKPHGSINWLLYRSKGDPRFDQKAEVSHDIPARIRLAAVRMFQGALGETGAVCVDPAAAALSSRQVFCSEWTDYQYAYPFMLAPLATKLYERFGALGRTVTENALTLAGQADHLTLIGYRGRDTVAHDLLSAVPHGVPVTVVSKGDAAAIQAALREQHPHLALGLTFDAGFDDYVAALQEGRDVVG